MIDGCGVENAKIMNDLEHLTPKMKEIVRREKLTSSSVEQIGAL